jgi:hypothetical protein
MMKFSKSRKHSRNVRIFLFMAIFAMMFNITVYADPPPGVETGNMNTLLTLIFWLVRIIIGVGGGIPSLIKVVQGKVDENPRDFNIGVASVSLIQSIFAPGAGAVGAATGG